VPQQVRTVIEQNIKGYEIDEIELDKDDGQIVYEVEAESQVDNDLEIKLKISPEGTLLEKEEQLNDDDLPIIILKVIEKSYGELDIDDVEKRYRHGRKTYYKVEGENDKFKVDLEIAEDGIILDRDVDEKGEDYDLPGEFRKIRRTVIQLIDQLRIVAIGDSRVEKGVDPQYFLGEENQKYPLAVSFGSCAKDMPMVQLLCEDYFAHGRKMEWVVYGLSTRVFNRYYRDGDDEEDILRSKIYRDDKAAWATIPKVTRMIPFNELNLEGDSPWGYDGDDGVDDDLNDEDEREDVIEDLQRGRYKFDLKRLEMFESTIQKLGQKNIKMLAFSPPMHPISKGQPCTDDDGTTRKAYDDFIAKMNSLEKKYSNFYFLDIHKKGEHDFEHECFNDFDHLNSRGGKKLSIMLNDFMVNVDTEAKTKNAKN
jgi:uncharacterized membrane protein YkoI